MGHYNPDDKPGGGCPISELWAIAHTINGVLSARIHRQTPLIKRHLPDFVEEGYASFSTVAPNKVKICLENWLAVLTAKPFANAKTWAAGMFERYWASTPNH